MTAFPHNLEDAGVQSSPAEGNGLESLVVALYREHAAGLMRYALTFTPSRELAEDAVQECFLRLFVALRDGREIANPKPWLYRVLRNLLLDCLRSESGTVILLRGAGPGCPNQAGGAELCVQFAEICNSVREVLSPRELECLQLRLEGFGYKEIAGTLQIRVGTVGALLARAIKKTQKIMRRGMER